MNRINSIRSISKIWLMIFSVFAFTTDKTHINIDDEPNLIHSVWTTWLKYGDTWLLIPIFNDQGEAIIRAWDKGGKIHEITRTSARIGISYISGSAVNQNGILAIRGLLKPVLYTFSLQDPSAGFSLMAPAANLSGHFMFWDDETIVGGDDQLLLSSFGDKPVNLGLLNKSVPDGRHPSHHRINHQKLLMAENQGQIAIGFPLTRHFVILDKSTGRKIKSAEIAFPGYIEPLQTYMKTFSEIQDNEWINGFHRLTSLSWFKGQLLGFFQKGHEGYGTWASLTGERFLWDNNKNEAKIQALADDEVVLGSVNLEEGEVVSWDFWRSHSLP